jgi:dethiobiotin synthetase
MTAYFITATGTDIGKTHMVEMLLREGAAGSAVKPVITGWDEANLEQTDTYRIIRAMGMTPDAKTIDAVSPWRFTAPLSPDMAAELEGREIRLEEVVEFCKRAMCFPHPNPLPEGEGTRGKPLLIEGVGGVMVPLNKHHTQLDWIKALNIPVILVTGSYLGTLSHTLTCLEVLATHHIPVHQIILNETRGSTVGLEATRKTLERFTESGIRVVRWEDVEVSQQHRAVL